MCCARLSRSQYANGAVRGLRVVWLLARVISRNVLKISHLMVDVCDKSDI